MLSDDDFPILSEAEVLDPIDLLAERVVDELGVPPVIPCEFDFIAYYEQRGLPRIFDYRHRDSRQRLRITADGRASTNVPPDDGRRRFGRFVITSRSWSTAIEALEIAEWAGLTPRDHYCKVCRDLIYRRGGTPTLQSDRAVASAEPSISPFDDATPTPLP